MSIIKQTQRDEAEEQEELSSLCTQSSLDHLCPDVLSMVGETS